MGMGGMGTQKAKLKRVGVHAASAVRRARHPRRFRHVPPSTRPCPPVPSPPRNRPGGGPIYAPAPLPILSFCPPNHRDESNNSSSNGGRGHGRLSRAPSPAGAIDENSCSTLHGRTRCPLWLRRPPWGPRRWLLPRRRRTGCAAVPAVAGRGRGRTSCTTRRRRRRRRRRRSRGGALAVRATGCSCWRRWRKRRKGRPRPRPRTSGPPLAPSPRGTRRKGRRWRAPGRRRGSRVGGRRRAPARSPASTPSTTPSPSSGGCRASSPASRGRSRTCRTWRSPAPPAARTCWPSRRTPSTSAAGSCGAAPSGGSPPPRSPRCRPSCRPSRPSTSATTASSTAAAAVADHQPIQGRVRRTCTDQIDPKEKRHAYSCMQVCKGVSNGIYYSTREERDKMDGWMDGSRMDPAL